MSTPLIIPWNGVTPQIAADAFIAPNATLIGDVVIGPGASIWFGCVLRADVSRIRIGARTNIQDGTIIHVNSGDLPTLIGGDVLVGHLAILHACTVESGAFIGMRATVMDRAVVESGAMVAAGALVNPGKRIPAGELWGGSPAKFMRKIGEKEAPELVNGPAGYAEIAQIYRKQLG